MADEISRTRSIARDLRSLVARMPAWAEFCLIFLITFSWPLIANFRAVLGRWVFHRAAHRFEFRDRVLLHLLIIEAVTLAVVYGIGRIRGWATEVFRFQLTWRWTVIGVLLWLIIMIATDLLYSFAHAYGLYHPLPFLGGAQVNPTLPFILINSLTNPVFEEFLESGYLIAAASKFGMWPAVLSSALLRACLHLYLGDFPAVVVLATGIIFGLTYWRWHQLWPLILAHALMDFFGLLHVNVLQSLHLI
jgi:membrane protease YdiL (CAAX protease family)